MPYGFSDEQWSEAKVELRRYLIALARRRQLIAYSDLVDQLEVIDFGPHDSRFFQLLDQVSTEEDESGRGLLTVVVVHKTGDMRPGPGFFELAEARGRDVEEIDKTWLAELDSVVSYWRDH